MSYTTVTNKGKAITATFVKDHIEIVVHDNWSTILEWAFTMDYAAHRFQWLIAHV